MKNYLFELVLRSVNGDETAIFQLLAIIFLTHYFYRIIRDSLVQTYRSKKGDNKTNSPSRSKLIGSGYSRNLVQTDPAEKQQKQPHSRPYRPIN